MLFFHYKGGLVKESHEWLSIVISVIAIWHLASGEELEPIHPVFQTKFSAGRIWTDAYCLISLYRRDGKGFGRRPPMVFMALSNATLEHTVPAFNLSMDEAMKRLKLAGYDAAPNETLNVIGKRAGKRGGDILFILAKKNEK